MNPYHRYVSELARLVHEGKQFPLGGFPTPPRPPSRPMRRAALIFSPHPDDECIIGGLALRLQREAGMRVVNVAVTQGSNKARQAARLGRAAAPRATTSGSIWSQTVPGGLEKINVKTRSGRSGALAGRRSRSSPRILARAAAGGRVLPARHRLEQHAHRHAPPARGRARAARPPDFTCHVVETEFWGAMATPNLMVESSVRGSRAT